MFGKEIIRGRRGSKCEIGLSSFSFRWSRRIWNLLLVCFSLGFTSNGLVCRLRTVSRDCSLLFFSLTSKYVSILSISLFNFLLHCGDSCDLTSSTLQLVHFLQSSISPPTCEIAFHTCASTMSYQVYKKIARFFHWPNTSLLSTP